MRVAILASWPGRLYQATGEDRVSMRGSIAGDIPTPGMTSGISTRMPVWAA